jgi:hypothetical protein
MKNYLRNIIFGLVIACLAVVVGSARTHADNTSANAAQGMQISPALVELNGSKDQTYSITVDIMNVTVSDMNYTTSVDDFTSADETGSPKIIQNSTLSDAQSIITWITKVPDFILKGQTDKKITVSLTIPSNAEPGGHYGVLRFSGAAPNMKTSGVGLSASAGVLFLVRVDGNITEEANLDSFYASDNGKQHVLFENGPVTFVTRIENIGNVHVKPVGNIEVRDMFGNLFQTLAVNEDKSNVLPKSIRRFDSTTKNGWMFGLYTASLTMGYGTKGQAITDKISFWVIPYKLILIILVILLTIIFILSRIMKAYNRRVIQKYKNEGKNKQQGKKKD